MNRLQLDSQSLCQQDQLDPQRKQEVQQSVRELEDEWRSVLRAAEDFVNKAETLACFDQQAEALKGQSQHLQSQIDDLDRKLRSHDTLQVSCKLFPKTSRAGGNGGRLVSWIPGYGLPACPFSGCCASLLRSQKKMEGV